MNKQGWHILTVVVTSIFWIFVSEVRLGINSFDQSGASRSKAGETGAVETREEVPTVSLVPCSTLATTSAPLPQPEHYESFSVNVNKQELETPVVHTSSVAQSGKCCREYTKHGYDYNVKHSAKWSRLSGSQLVEQCAEWCVLDDECVAFGMFKGGETYCHLCSDTQSLEYEHGSSWWWYGAPAVKGGGQEAQARLKEKLSSRAHGRMERELKLTKQLLDEAVETADRLRKAGAGTSGAAVSKINFGRPEGDYEEELRSKVKFTKVQRHLPERFPLPAIQVRVDTSRGCIIGSIGCNQLVLKGPFPHDPHIRDIIASAMTPCLFRQSPCLALDIGASIGIMTLTMLHLNAHVVSVEPQPDICASLMETVAINGFSSRSRVRCGGIATSADLGKAWLAGFHPRGLYRYDGPVEAPFDEHAYNLDMSRGVPLHNLAELVPGSGEEVQFLKVDTDSIDHDVLTRQILPKLKSGEWKVRNLCFETGKPNEEWSGALHDFQNLGYTIYRTLLWQYQFHEDGSRPVDVPHDVPTFADEVFELRFNRYLWRFHKLSLDEWRSAVAQKAWQYFVTLDDIQSNAMAINERT